MKQSVPFYANTADDMRCLQACYRMVLKYFLPDREFTWEEIDKLLCAEVGKGTWWHAALLGIEKLGIRTKLIEPFDYQKFFDQGIDYLYTIYPKKLADWHKEKSNLFSVKHLIPEFLHTCHFENRPATFDDFDSLPSEGWLIGTEINARTLSGKEGLSPHMILVFAKEGDRYLFHDPGLPPLPNRTATQDQLIEARKYAGENKMSLVAFRKQ
jgi:hypothetical protein